MDSFELLIAQLKPGVYSGGDGSSEENAIIINIESTPEGIEAEFEYLQVMYGVENVTWELVLQQLYDKDDRYFDILEIKLAKDGSIHKVYFEATKFFGKFGDEDLLADS